MAGAQPTSQARDQCRVAGRYDLVGVNGSLPRVELESDASEEGPELRAFLVEGELHLAPDQSWRRAGPDLGRVAMVSANGGTSSAAVTRLSLVRP